MYVSQLVAGSAGKFLGYIGIGPTTGIPERGMAVTASVWGLGSKALLSTGTGGAMKAIGLGMAGGGAVVASFDFLPDAGATGTPLFSGTLGGVGGAQFVGCELPEISLDTAPDD